ncbi:unnamed protein product [Cunninghamella blakesleeana]
MHHLNLTKKGIFLKIILQKLLELSENYTISLDNLFITGDFNYSIIRPTVTKNKDPFFANEKLEQALLFQEETFNTMMKCYRSEKLFQKALQKNTVIFEIPTKDFHDIIEKQCGQLYGINNLQNNNHIKPNTIIITCVFDKDKYMHTALTKGITHTNINYKGTLNIYSKEELPSFVTLKNITLFLAINNVFWRICKILMMLQPLLVGIKKQ